MSESYLIISLQTLATSHLNYVKQSFHLEVEAWSYLSSDLLINSCKGVAIQNVS